MAGIKALRRIQMGLETTKGTKVVADTYWRGEGVLKDNLQVVFPAEDVGMVIPVDRSYIPKLEAGISLEPTPATFEQLPYLLSCGIEKLETGVADGGGSGKVYEYNFPSTAVNDFSTLSIEGGDDAGEEEGEYFFAQSITLSGKGGESVMMSAELVGRQIIPDTFTGSLALPAVEEILFGKGTLTLDPATTYPATTAKSNTLLAFELAYKTGIHAVYTGDAGQLYFAFAKMTRPEATLKVTFEHDATSIAEKVAWRAETARSMRLRWSGSTLTTSGSYTTKTLIIDAVGLWESFDVLDEQDGNDIVTGTLQVRYNATAAASGRVIVVNQLTSLP